MRQTVVGVFDRYADAQHAARQLRDSGFSDSVFVTQEPELGTGSDAATGSTAAPRDEGVMAHVRHFFSDLFGRDDDPQVTPYAEAVRRGGAVVKVDVEEDRQLDAVRDTLEAAGAVDIDERAAEWRASGWSEGIDPVGTTAGTGTTGLGAGSLASRDLSGGTAGSGQTLVTGGGQNVLEPSGTGLSGSGRSDMARAGTTTEREGVLPVVREELQVGKRMTDTGTVRVYSRTSETPVEESINLRSEHAEVVRRPVDRPATAAELQAFQDRTIEVRETAEQPVVAKTARVVEEVSVGKSVEEHTEVVRDTVRSTDVEVERSGAESTSPSATGMGYESFDTGFREDFRNRYGAAGGSYDEYEPAYRYGHSLASDNRYSGRSWDELEPDVRRDWDSRYPGENGSTWERMKAAVRHGWEKMTGHGA